MAGDCQGLIAYFQISTLKTREPKQQSMSFPSSKAGPL